MILDNLLLFDTGLAITATAASTNQLDLVNARDMGVGNGDPLRLLILTGTAFTTSNGGTLTVQLQVSTDNVTYTTVDASPAYTAAQLTANTALWQVDVARFIQANTKSTPRYVRLNYLVANAFTAGTLSAFIVPNRDDTFAYPPGVTVSN